MQSKIKILLVVNYRSQTDPFKVSGVEYHRLLIPYINLTKSSPIELHQINEISPENTDLSKFQLVIFSRVISNFGNDEAVLQALKKADVPYIVDVDDYWHLPANHLLYSQWKQFNMVRRIELALKNAAAVITTTPHLAAQVRKLNKNVVIAPNAIDPQQPQFAHQPKLAQTVRVGWVGGLCHTDDIPLLQRGFDKLYNDALLQKHFTVNLCGYSPQNFDVWGWYEQIFTAGKPRPNYKRVQGLDIRHYATLYNGLDVCLVPLANTPFNRCKSPLKLIEAGWFKKPCVVSRQYPYTLLGQHYKNLLFVDNDKIDWYKYTKKLIESPALRHDLGEALHQTVKDNYLIDKVNSIRAELIESILNEETVSM
jgi:glycosyltransferase involved in cell wall biosynthesis